MQTICDAWMTELTTHVAGLADAKQHLYAPWSPEALYAETGERHIAVWPQGDPELVQGLVAGSPPADLATQSFAILAWEDASVDSSRRQDDDTANAAWIALYEAIRARLYVQANARLGDAQIMDTHYRGGVLDAQDTKRVLSLRFEVRIPISFT